ncbi:MAG: hypothetical protein WKG07_04980 [Hymenobacter sp.]
MPVPTAGLPTVPGVTGAPGTVWACAEKLEGQPQQGCAEEI